MFKRILIGVAVLAVLGGAGLFVLDRTIFASVEVSESAPLAPTLVAPTLVAPTSAATTTDSSSVAPTQSSVAATSTGAQVYKIDASQSEVRYEVGETFFDQNNRFNTAIGRTKGIAGEILVNFAQPAQSQIGNIVIDVSQFTSDEARRDNFIRRTGLESATYPQATFKTTSITGMPAKAAVGDQLSLTITGDLTVKQTTRPVTWDVTLKVGNNQLTGSASTQIKMSDFGVGPLQLPILQTQDGVKLFLDFVAVPAN